MWYSLIFPGNYGSLWPSQSTNRLHQDSFWGNKQGKDYATPSQPASLCSFERHQLMLVLQMLESRGWAFLSAEIPESASGLSPVEFRTKLKNQLEGRHSLSATRKINGKNCYLVKTVMKLKKIFKAEEWEKNSKANSSQYPVPSENNVALFAAPAWTHSPLVLKLGFKRWISSRKHPSTVKEK